jgi:hypothetical protein
MNERRLYIVTAIGIVGGIAGIMAYVFGVHWLSVVIGVIASLPLFVMTYRW